MSTEPEGTGAPVRGERRLLSSSPEETERWGERLGERLAAGDVVALEGELGAGKTTFVRGLARGLQVSEPPTSPSFVLMQEYQGRIALYHFDAWMERRESMFLQGGGAEYLGGDGVAVIEWAERVTAFLPRPRLRVVLSHRSPDERELRLSVVPGPRTGRSGLEERLRAIVNEL